MEALIASLAKTFPSLDPTSVVSLAKQTQQNAGTAARPTQLSFSCPAKCIQSATMQGLLHRQILLTVGDPTVRFDFNEVTKSVNRSLTDVKETLCIESTSSAYGSWALLTTEVATDRQLGIVQKCIISKFKLTTLVEVALLSLKSYMEVINVPALTRQGGSTMPEHVLEAMHSWTHQHLFVLADPVQVIKNSKSTNTATAYFEVWDSKWGMHALSPSASAAGSGVTHLIHARHLCLAVLNAPSCIIWGTIGPWHPAVGVNPSTCPPSLQHRLVSPVYTLCVALTVVRGMSQLITNACFGATAWDEKWIQNKYQEIASGVRQD
ncbi:hypothetical protein NP233_g5943 [Leucocoprinus birnbaumii]|uniref:Uncharacterized protein n=1 Tax=Leucocoprinus birnbaumii TaxID=56174 RepID=A0AAD5VRW8_9AGAR|nr:hypothetical protein NP233_g5943 [Leucocoprinus birnbaumii]